MKPDSSPLVGRLTLAVLSLILVCLVLLVLRAYQPGRSGLFAAPDAPAAPGADETEMTEVAPAPAPAPEPAEPIEIRQFVSRPVLTNRPVPVRTPVPTARALPDEAAAVERPESSTGSSRSSQRATGPGAPAETIPGGGFANAPGTASLTGVVRLNGVPPPEIQIDMGPSCGTLHTAPVLTRRYRVGPGGGLQDAVVYVKRGLPGRFPPVNAAPVLDQAGCMFEPYVMGVVTGQRFEIWNSDATLHNVHATPKLNRQFNIGMAGKGQKVQKSFDRPEMFIRLKCDVHPWMFAYVAVLDHPFFAVSDPNGAFQLPALLPAGTYVIGAQHLRAGELEQTVTIGEGEQLAIDFTFAVPARPLADATRKE